VAQNEMTPDHVEARRPGAPNRTEQQDSPASALERTVETLRGTVASLEREVGVLRADLERYRVEMEKAAGARIT
jgi:hypothetical protein